MYSPLVGGYVSRRPARREPFIEKISKRGAPVTLLAIYWGIGGDDALGSRALGRDRRAGERGSPASLGAIVLVSHSYGGMVLTDAATRPNKAPFDIASFARTSPLSPGEGPHANETFAPTPCQASARCIQTRTEPFVRLRTS